jgi:hypothetical protein
MPRRALMGLHKQVEQKSFDGHRIVADLVGRVGSRRGPGFE